MPKHYIFRILSIIKNILNLVKSIPPHCDTLDGPVVLAAKEALENNNVNFILPWVHLEGEKAVEDAFEKAIKVYNGENEDAKNLAEYWFFETVVRIHREGEGAAYTGLKPAGLDPGPIIPKVDKGIENEDISEVIKYIQGTVAEEITEYFKHVMHSKEYDVNDVPSARKHINAYLHLTLYSHHLYHFIKHPILHEKDEH
ncbi:MAG: DUF6448 family protein [Candidatus Thorarchaeota archaeon]